MLHHPNTKVTLSEAQTTLDEMEANKFAELYKSRWNADHASTIVPSLIRCLSVSDTAVLYRTMSALGRIGHESEQAIDAVIDLIPHVDPIINDLAVHTLGRIGLRSPARVIPTLTKAASIVVTQKQALFALLGFGHAAASTAPVFAEAFRSRDSRIRKLALRGLKEIGASADIVEPVLSLALNDKNREIRTAAEKLAASSQQVTRIKRPKTKT